MFHYHETLNWLFVLDCFDKKKNMGESSKFEKSLSLEIQIMSIKICSKPIKHKQFYFQVVSCL